MKSRALTLATLSLLFALLAAATAFAGTGGFSGRENDLRTDRFAGQAVEEGRPIFRFDTFGSESFWGDALQLHRAIAGQSLGGVGPGVSPRTALALGLKVDADAIPGPLAQQILQGQVISTTLPPPSHCSN